MTVEAMQDFCIAIMQEKGIPVFLGCLLTRQLPRLARWKKP